jgi:hypothetical protein
LKASLVLLLASIAASSCMRDDEDDDDEGDDDDVPAAWAPERTPPGAVTPSSDASYDASPGASPEASSPESGASASDSATSACDSGVPEGSAAFCAWRAQGLCFDQAEQACACAGCSLAHCALANPTTLDAPLDVACSTPALPEPPSASDAGPDA